MGETLKTLLETEMGIPVRIVAVTDRALIDEGSAIVPTVRMRAVDPTLTGPFQVLYENSELRSRYGREDHRQAARSRARTLLEGLV